MKRALLVTLIVCGGGLSAFSEEEAVVKDTVVQVNRSLFDRLFSKSSTPAPLKKDLSALTLSGAAIAHPYRTHKAIHDIVFTHLEVARGMYRRRLLIDPDLTGELLAVFNITWEGVVTDLVLKHSTLHDGKLEKSIMATIKTWKFKKIPKKDGDVTVAYPLRFNP